MPAADRFRAWMLTNLDRAASEFGVTVTGRPVYGWRLRSISAAATGPTGERWLRVGTERESDLPHHCWDGLPTANAVTGVPKPVVLASAEWQAHQRKPARRVRADLMTLLPGLPCAPAEVLRTDPELPESWWHALRHGVTAIGATPTGRTGGWRNPRVREMFGAAAGRLATVTDTAAAHCDLHWANLHGPVLGVIDWEMWGAAPVGTDAATLYCYSALVPQIAERVWRTFADILDTAAGLAALLRVAARLLYRAPREYPDLTEPLRALVAQRLR